MVHAGEEPLQNGQLPMSFILENQRLRHWVGDGTSPSDSMFDVVARQKLTMRDNHNMLKKSEPSRRQQLMGIDEEVKAHRKMMDDLKRIIDLANLLDMAKFQQVPLASLRLTLHSKIRDTARKYMAS